MVNSYMGINKWNQIQYLKVGYIKKQKQTKN